MNVPTDYSQINKMGAEIERLRAIEKAARDYYMGYVQDEAAEWEVCIDERQHERAIALRDALALTSGEGNSK